MYLVVICSNRLIKNFIQWIIVLYITLINVLFNMFGLTDIKFPLKNEDLPGCSMSYKKHHFFFFFKKGNKTSSWYLTFLQCISGLGPMVL